MDVGNDRPPLNLLGGYKSAEGIAEGIVTWGVDSLVISAYVDFSWSWPDISVKFENMREKCQLLQTPYLVLDEAAYGDTVKIHVSSMRRYRFHLELPFCHMFIMNTASPSGDTPNVRIDFLAKALWLGDWPQLWEDLQKFIRSLNGRWDSYHLNKVALTVDRVYRNEIGLSEFVENLKTHIKHVQPFLENGKMNGCYVGKKDSKEVGFKIYNKSKEIAERELSGKHDAFYMSDLWGRSALKKLIYRFEFTLGADYLKLIDCRTIEALKEKHVSIWQDLCSSKVTWLQPGENSQKCRRDWRTEWHELYAAFGNDILEMPRRKPSKPAPVEFYQGRHIKVLGALIGAMQDDNELYEDILTALDEIFFDLKNNDEALQEIGQLAQEKRKAIRRQLLKVQGEFTAKNDFFDMEDNLDDW